ncbi:hypothetical protein PSACC_01233 [Paramicrosporidium saccamoebae]|uniref:Amino acid transporter n=1 Tax=Paramicrosporidium saccamoebae TaxID=1246581 RepID=A0A2H9TMK1_9FUNG|nr:hypothetical protein PSACC_01233 [Paramicrosporidium saccamoebae]
MSNEVGKTPSTIEAGKPVRSLTLFDGISTIVGLMVGSGIFSTAGEIQKNVGSPGFALVIWALTGLLGLTGALCYAELGTMIPGSGGEAQYLARGLGPMMVFLFNWTSIIILKPGTIAILSVATAEYMLQMVVEKSILEDKAHAVFYSWLTKGIAILCCIVVTLASSLSTKWSNRIQGVLTLGKIGALTLVICSGCYFAIFVDSSVIKENLGEPFKGSVFGFGLFAAALNHGLWAFEGWNNLNIVAGDLANPQVNLPLGIWISMTAVVALYLLTNLGYYSVLPMMAIENTSAVGIDFGLRVFGRVGGILMPILVASSTFGSALSSMVTSSEIVLLAAQTGQLPAYFNKVSPTFGTAFRAYWMQGVISCFLCLFTDFNELIMIYTFPTWIFYAACVIVLLRLRLTAPDLERPYRVWLSTPILFLIACVWLQVTSLYAEFRAVSLSFLAVLVGIPLYYLFVRPPTVKGEANSMPLMTHK